MQTIKLIDVCEFVRNGANIKQLSNETRGIPITRIETLANDRFNRDRLGYANITDDSFSDYYLKRGDVLLSHINGAKFIGRSVIYEPEEGETIIHGMNLLCLRFKSNYNPKFFCYYAKSKAAKNYFDKHTKKAVNQASITSTDIKNMPIPDLTIDEQNKIVAIFDSLYLQADLIEQEEKLFNELIKSRFIEMFGDPNLNTKGFDKGIINDVGKCIAGATPSTAKPEYWENGTIPWMSSGEVNKCRIYETDTKITQLGYENASTKLIPPHSVVLAMAGQGKTRGTAAMAEIELCTNQSICSIVGNKKVNPEYLLMFLRMQYQELRDSSNGAEGRGGLNLKIIGNFPIIIPPISLQNEFASFVELIDKSKFILKNHKDRNYELIGKKMSDFFFEYEED